MDLNTSLVNKLLDEITGRVEFTKPTTVYATAFIGDPFNGGTEVGTPGTAGYARQAITYGSAAASRSIANTAQIQITMPNTGGPWNVSWIAVYDASTGGNLLWRVPILGTTFETNVTASTDTFVVQGGHGFSTDDRVVFDASNVGPALPTGITAGTTYYVLASGLTATAFKVSTTSGGAALDVTADGECLVRKVTVQPFNASNILQIAVGALTISL